MNSVQQERNDVYIGSDRGQNTATGMKSSFKRKNNSVMISPSPSSNGFIKVANQRSLELLIDQPPAIFSFRSNSVQINQNTKYETELQSPMQSGRSLNIGFGGSSTPRNVALASPSTLKAISRNISFDRNLSSSKSKFLINKNRPIQVSFPHKNSVQFFEPVIKIEDLKLLRSNMVSEVES